MDNFPIYLGQLKERKQMAKEKSESSFLEIFKTMSETSVRGNLYGRMFALQEMELYIIAEKIKIKKHLKKLNERNKPVPMTEEQEYRNAGISKEEARKNEVH